MKFANLLWAVANDGRPHYKIALSAGLGEARFSRCLSGRSQFTSEERERVAGALGYSLDWLFTEIRVPRQSVESTLTMSSANEVRA